MNARLPELFGVPWKGAVPQRVSSPARQLSFQPVAVGAVEGGNGFSRSTPVQRAAKGGLATMWAATQVNVEQASKRATRRPTRRITGKAGIGREASDARTSRLDRSNDGGTRGRGGRWQHGKPCRWIGTRQPEPREGQAGPAGWRRGPPYRGSRVMAVERRASGAEGRGKIEGLREWLRLGSRIVGREFGARRLQ